MSFIKKDRNGKTLRLHDAVFIKFMDGTIEYSIITNSGGGPVAWSTRATLYGDCEHMLTKVPRKMRWKIKELLKEINE